MIIYYIGGPIGIGALILFFLVAYVLSGDASWIVGDLIELIKPGFFFFLFLLAIIGFTVFCLLFVKKNAKLLLIFIPLWLFVTDLAALVYMDAYYENFSTKKQLTSQQLMNLEARPFYFTRLYKGSYSNIILVDDTNTARINKIEIGDLSFNRRNFMLNKNTEISFFDINYFDFKNDKFRKKRVYLPDNYEDMFFCKKAFISDYISVAKIIFDGDKCWLTEIKKNNKKSKLQFEPLCYFPKYSDKLKCPCWIKEKTEIPADYIELKTEIIE